MPPGRPRKQTRTFGTGNHSTDNDTCTEIYLLSDLGWKAKKIHSTLCAIRRPIGIATIFNILREREQGKIRHVTKVDDNSSSRKRARTKEVIAQVRKKAKRENPPTVRRIAAEVGISPFSAFKAIHEDCGFKTKKKARVHQLNERQKANRAENSAKLFNTLSEADSLEFAVTLDETWFALQDSGKGRPIFFDFEWAMGLGARGVQIDFRRRVHARNASLASPTCLGER